MKQKHKHLLIAALGICLIAGGTALGIAWSHQHPSPQNTDSSQASGSSQIQSSPEQINGDSPLLNAKLTGEADVPGLPSKMIRTENGFYYFGKTADQNGNGFLRFVLKYADKQSGECVVVCAKPECTHLNEYCTARNTRYQAAGDEAVYYDGYLYQMVTKYPADHETPTASPDGITNDYEGAEPILIRYAPDGTALEELVSFEGTLSETLKDFDGTGRIVAHKGALWISASFTKSLSTVDTSGSSSTDYFSQYGIYHYEISSGKLTCVLSTETLLKNTSFAPFTQLNALGDYVYCLKGKADWKDPLNKYSGVIRIHAETGAVEDWLPDALDYAICEDYILYTMEKYVTNAAGYSVPKAVFYLYDLKTGESKPFLKDTYWLYPQFTCTKEWIIFTNIEDGSPALMPLKVYDLQGNLLKECPIPLLQWEFTDDGREIPVGNAYEQLETLGFVAADGDTLYLGSSDDALCDCSIPDLLAGNAEWTMRYNDSEPAMMFGYPSKP
ncbi:MAG: hypothetical protein IKM30_03560 [Oscillospiraceae bacterium]|nr:hypothetical protein [Oscillospiraceae bacterium]